MNYKDLKIKFLVSSPKESIMVQSYLAKLGVFWRGSDKKLIKNIDQPVLVIVYPPLSSGGVIRTPYLLFNREESSIKKGDTIVTMIDIYNTYVSNNFYYLLPAVKD